MNVMIKKKLEVALGIVAKNALTGPMEVSIDLTRKCTLNCVMCWWHSPLLEKHPSKQWINESMDYDLFKKLIRDLTKVKVKRIILGGQGDPMLYPKLFDAIELAKTAGMEVALITSGFFLNEKKIRALFDLKIDSLDVSLQAATPEIYLKMHPGHKKDTFDRIKNCITLLASLKKSKKLSNPRIQIIHIVCSYNYHESVKVVEFASEVGADSIGFKRVDVVPETEKLLLNENQLKELKTLLGKAEQKAKELNINTGLETFNKFILPGLTTGKYTIDFYSQIPCYAGWTSARILETGDVIPCCGCYELIIGNIKKRSFIDIWNSEKYKHFRGKGLNVNKKLLMQKGCKCFSCVDYGSNFGIFKKLHPFESKRCING
jgi:MoaA/NifB/PqqE/SkfB family radical SAM enzyme